MSAEGASLPRARGRRAAKRVIEKDRSLANRAPIFPRVWLTSCQHVFYLHRRFKISSPAPALARAHTRVQEPVSPEYLVPGYQRGEITTFAHPRSSLCRAAGRLFIAPARRAIRPRLTHRYSRGLLGARGKMRQVVVRSRSPGTREIRPLSSPLHRLLRSLARQRAIHSCGYIMRACVGRVCMRVPRARRRHRRRGRYIFLLDDRDRGPINGCPCNDGFRHD